MSETKTAADRDVSSEQTFDPPRDPEAFAPTDHFMERFDPGFGRWSETRACPSITADVVKTSIEEGTFEHAGGDRDRYAYEADVGRHTWRVVVEIDPERVGEPGARHSVVTAYATGVHR